MWIARSERSICSLNTRLPFRTANDSVSAFWASCGSFRLSSASSRISFSVSGRRSLMATKFNADQMRARIRGSTFSPEKTCRANATPSCLSAAWMKHDAAVLAHSFVPPIETSRKKNRSFPRAASEYLYSRDALGRSQGIVRRGNHITNYRRQSRQNILFRSTRLFHSTPEPPFPVGKTATANHSVRQNVHQQFTVNRSPNPSRTFGTARFVIPRTYRRKQRASQNETKARIQVITHLHYTFPPIPSVSFAYMSKRQATRSASHANFLQQVLELARFLVLPLAS